ncbi:MAG: chromosome segregation protein, partial [Acidimicrobiales bacterium]|nr:chromosome segregation protein [Acidimicrobiales bacterium]
MRPTRLQLQGFTAFRDHTEVDFADADLFALTGPTGAGKSSLIDAMVFALYGCVPRLDRKMVAPLLSLGKNEARVQLDFTVGGVAYTAARVVRRTKTGATTKEARLESGGVVLAGNEKELTEAVERLLGLNFEHFTTCVVLPQGKFMKLLHATGSDRQDLLVSLLDLGLFERMARLASLRERGARQRAEVAGTLVEKLAFATEEALATATVHVAELVALRAEVDAAAPELDRLRDVQSAAEAQAAAAAAQVRQLEGVAVPPGLDDHAAEVVEARDRASGADAEVERCADAADGALAVLAALPDRGALEAALRAHDEQARLAAERETAAELLAARAGAVDQAQVAAVEAEVVLAEAVAAVERAQWEHRAHDVAGSLIAGEPCPVCQQLVAELPPAVAPGDVEAARQAKRAADGAVAAARTGLQSAIRQQERGQAALEAIAARLTEIRGALGEWPDRAVAAGRLAEVTEAEASSRCAGEAASAARRAAINARKAAQATEGRDVEARRAFDAVRDRVAALGPPVAERRDLEADWVALA